MTIFRMYGDYGNRTGFFVQHRSWRNTCALIVSVGGRRSGRLPGRAPLFGSPPVFVRWYDVRSGRPVAPPTPADGPESLADPADAHYGFIASPSWYRPNSLDIPQIEPAEKKPARV